MILNRCALVFGLVLSLSSAAAAKFDWPQWRGPSRDGVSKEIGLLKSWPDGGPKRVWLFENAGNGYSSFAVANGKLLTMGTRENGEVLIALDAGSGEELWVTALAELYNNKWGGGPRGTPTVDGDRVFAMSGKGILVCANLADGKMVWRADMTELGGKLPGWGYTESVFVDGDKVICTPGGAKGAVAALDKKSGQVIWQSSDFTDNAHYSSAVPAKINGVDQYVQRSEKNVVGIAARDGKVLWKTDFPFGRTAVIPTPIVRDNFVYVTAGYGAGCKMVKVGPDFKVEMVYENKVMKNHHGGVILIGDHVYGHADAGWTCQNFQTGEEVWNHRGFDKGAIAFADGMFYTQEERSGVVALIEASPSGWKEHGRVKLDPQSKIRSPDGRIWTHPVISNGKLYLRDQEYIYCFDVKGSDAS